MTKYSPSTKLYVASLIALGVATHLIWFRPGTTLFYGDWKLLSDSVVDGMLNYGRAAWIDVLDLGKANIQLHNFPYRYLWGIIGISDLAVKLTLLWPIALLSFLSPFYLAKTLTKNNNASLLSALAFGLNSYLIVRSTRHLPIAMVIVLSPLIIAKTITLIKKFSYRDLITVLLLLWCAVIYELRIALIVILIQFLLVLFINARFLMEKKLPIVIFSTLFLLLNTFWLLPSFQIGTNDINTVASRNVWGDEFTDSARALSAADYKWTGEKPISEFIAQPIPIYAWALPVVALFAVVKYTSITPSGKRYVTAFGALVILGVFLVKQNAPPFSGSYTVIFERIPFFGLYRVASKFNLVTIIGYTGLASFAFLRILRYKTTLSRVVLAGLTIALLAPSLPLMSGKIGTLFIDREEPPQYAWLNENYLNTEYFQRSFWIPHYSNWGDYGNDNPKVSFWNVINNNWSQFKESKFDGNFDDLVHSIGKIESPLFDKLLDTSSVQYIIVPEFEERGDDELYDSYEQYQKYVDELREISYLDEVNDARLKDIKLFENRNFDPEISSVKSVFALEGTNDWDLLYGHVLTQYAKEVNSINKTPYFITKQAEQKNSEAINGVVSFQNIDNLESSNSIVNGSFESGAWTDEVGDCNNNSPTAYISMDISTNEKADGQQSLRLGAKNHIACTHTVIDVEPNSWYILSFEHKGQGKDARYNIASTSDINSILAERIDSSPDDWTKHQRVLYVPENTTELRLTFYGEPDSLNTGYSYTYYDSVEMHRADSLDDLFSFTDIQPPNQGKEVISSEYINPNKRQLRAANVSENFILSFTQAYHPKWRVDKILDEDHFILSGWQNGWFVDVNDLCVERQLCARNADGSWDIELTIEFTPQKWFYVGSVISGVTFIGVAGYLGYDWRNRRRGAYRVRGKK